LRRILRGLPFWTRTEINSTHRWRVTKGKGTEKAREKGKHQKKRGAKTKKSDPSTIIDQARADAFTDETPANAFAHFRSLAETVPTADLAPFTGQPLLMRANILTALEAVAPHLLQAVEALRAPRLEEIFELPALVMALDYAANRVPVAKLGTGEIDKLLSEGAPWRELLLSYLEVASHPLIGLLPRERVAAIRAGTGKLDKAQDFVALPGLFAEYASKLAGKHPFPIDKLDLLSVLGGTLMQNLRPNNAVVIAKRSIEAILRDQFGKLVADRYDHLQVIATVALGKRKADELLPALRSWHGASQVQVNESAEVGSAEKLG